MLDKKSMKLQDICLAETLGKNTIDASALTPIAQKHKNQFQKSRMTTQLATNQTN